MRNILNKNIILIVLLFTSVIIRAQLTPQTAINSMIRGINIGNTMEPPTEGAWGNPAVQEYAFDDYKNAGFTSIRIPITWDGHLSKTWPYTVVKLWMDRVEQVVNWGLKRKLFIIINVHHDDWIKKNYADASTRARFDSLWVQISERFKTKSDSLIFEIINEPNGLTLANLNELNTRTLSIIRKNNPTRLVIFSGNGWSNSADLIAANIPDVKDKYLIGYYHSYDPYPFGLEGPGTYGSASDINATKTKFDQVASWSAKNNIPVMISEFGAQKKCDYNSRMTYLATVVDQAIRHGVAFNAWDDGGNFPIYKRTKGGWNEIKDILIYTNVFSPNQFKYIFTDTTAIKLSWTNRTTSNDSIIVDRGINAAQFIQYAKIASSSAQFMDKNLLKGNVYYYRLRTKVGNSDIYSYPIRTDTVGKKGISITGLKSENEIVPEFSLSQNYPNPFNPETIISFKIQVASYVTLKVHDILGREVATLVDEIKQPGVYHSQFPSSRVGSILNSQLVSGVYFYTLRAGEYISTKKMLLIK